MTANHHSGEFDIPSDLGEARRVQDEIVEILQASHYGWPERDIFAIKLAL